MDKKSWNIVKALNFATEAHRGQARKHTGEEYITHPIAVADLVEEFLDNEGTSEKDVQTAIMVALLHDTVEDTDITIDDIRNNFGDEVAKGVFYLTDPPVFVGNRKTRKALTVARLTDAPRWVRIIKRFDIMHNEESLRIHDPKFHKVFVEETTELLFHMSMGPFRTLEEYVNDGH